MKFVKWMIPTLLLAVGCIFMAGISTGCASNTDPQAVLDTASDLADVAEVAVGLGMKPGKDRDDLIAEIERLRAVGDLPALRRIVARFRPTTQAVK